MEEAVPFDGAQFVDGDYEVDLFQMPQQVSIVA
jgi:hypothetical protein